MEALSSSTAIKWNDLQTTTLEFTKSTTVNNYDYRLFDSINDEFLSTSDAYNDIRDQFIHISHSITSTHGIKYSLGYNYNVKEVEYLFGEISEHEENYREQDDVQSIFQNAYISADGEIKNWHLNAGIKWTKQQESHRSFISPRFNLRNNINEHISFNFSYARMFQFINQLEEFGGFDLNLNGNIWILKDVNDEYVTEASKYSFGTLFTKNGWLIDVSAYWNKTSGLSILQSSSLGIDAAFQNGMSESRGVDLLINKKTGSLKSWVNYSISDNKYFFPDISETPFAATIEQKHIFKFINKLNIRNAQLMLSYQYKSGLPYSEPSGIEILDGSSDEYQIGYDFINNRRLDDYHRVDFGVMYTHQQKNVNMELSLSVLNLFNNTNTLSRTSFLDENEDGELYILSSEKRLLKRTPLLMVRLFW